MGFDSYPDFPVELDSLPSEAKNFFHGGMSSHSLDTQVGWQSGERTCVFVAYSKSVPAKSFCAHPPHTKTSPVLGPFI